MLNQCRCSSIQGAQRRQVRCGNRKLRSQMTPERRGYHGYRIEQPATHAQKANLKGQPQLECRPTPILNQLPLRQCEGEKGLDLKGGQFPRQLLRTQKRGLPVAHRTLLNSGAIASLKSRTAMTCFSQIISVTHS